MAERINGTLIASKDKQIAMVDQEREEEILASEFRKRRRGMRPGKMEYFLSIALHVARRSTCLRRNYGAVIVDKRGHIISTGYNGQPHGMTHCQVCYRQQRQLPPGERYELCRSIHAEVNALLIPSMDACEGGVLYIAGFDPNTKKEIMAVPCTMCWRVILNTPLEAICAWMRGDRMEWMPLERVRRRCPEVIVEGVTEAFWEQYDRISV